MKISSSTLFDTRIKVEMLEMLQGDSVSYILQQKHQKSAFTLYSTRPGTGSEYVDTN